MKGRWAAGIVPRNFAWIVKDRLAVSERPGGYAPHHRPVRRQEEILWLSAQGFSRVVSLLPSTHNLHAYEDLHLPSAHFPLPMHEDVRDILQDLYPSLLGWMRKGERLLVHQEELGERVAGVMAGFLFWSGTLPEPPLAISAIEQLLRRQLGSAGRAIVAQSVELSPPLDESGVPLMRRTVLVETSLLAISNFADEDLDRFAPASAPAAVPAPTSSIASKRPAKRSVVAKPTEKVAAIRPITKATKVASAPAGGAKSAVPVAAKKRAAPEAKPKAAKPS